MAVMAAGALVSNWLGRDRPGRVAARTGRVHEVAVSTLRKMRYPSSVVRRPSPVPPEQYDQDAILALINDRFGEGE